MSAHDDFEEGAYQPQSRADAESMEDAPLACRLARQRLRDFADGDLGEADLRIVEHHVHECRACALELARAEFETLRIRRAFADSWAQAKPRPGFTRRALARALSQEPEVALQAEAVRRIADAEAGRPSTDAAPKRLLSRVMARTVADIVSSTSAEPPHRRRGVLALLGVLALFLVALASPVWQSVADLTGSPRLAVVRADQASLERAGKLFGLSAGDGLGEGDMLVLNESGTIDAEYYDASVVGEQPAAQIRLQGDSELQVGLQLQLEHGQMEILSHRPMELLLGDGSTLELGSGLYQVAAERLDERDGTLSLRVEVARGDAARLSRADGNMGVVSVGQAGGYGRGSSGIAVENLAPVATGLASAGGVRQPAPAPSAPDLLGSVVDAYGSPLAHASVRLSFPTSAGYVTRSLSTDHAGAFAVAAGSGLQAGAAMLEAAPPAGRQDLEFWPIQAMRIESEDGRLTMQPVVLGAAAQVRATITDAAGQPRPHALALPVLYDEALGQVWPWMEGAAWADAQGRVELRGLPARQVVGRALGVVVFHPEDETAFRPLPPTQAGSFVQSRLETRSQGVLRLVGLPPSRASVVLEEVVGLPPGLAVRRHLVTADVNGQVEALRCGRGRLWLETSPSSPVLNPIARSADTGEVAGESIERRSVLRPMLPVPGIAGSGLEIAAQHRFQEAEVEPASGEELFLLAPTGALLGDAQAYALRSRVGGGFDARFLGLTRQGASLRMHLHAGETELLAIGRDGMFSRRDALSLRGGAAHGRLGPLVLESPGRAELVSELAPVADELRTTWSPLAFGPAGARPEIYRTLRRVDNFAAESLPPGDYQVRDSLQRTFRVRILPGQTVPIR